MIKLESSAVWVKCDMCGFTQFAGFDLMKRFIVERMRGEGWTMGDNEVCPFCNGKADTDEWKRPYKGAFLF